MQVGLFVAAVVGRIDVIVSQKQYDKAISDLEKTFFTGSTTRGIDYGESRAKSTYLMGVCYKGPVLLQPQSWRLPLI